MISQRNSICDQQCKAGHSRAWWPSRSAMNTLRNGRWYDQSAYVCKALVWWCVLQSLYSMFESHAGRTRLVPQTEGQTKVQQN